MKLATTRPGSHRTITPRLLACVVGLTVLATLSTGVAPPPASAAVTTTPLKTRDIGGVPVTCNSEVFITSLNDDDDNNNDTPDLRETLPLKNRRGANVPENNLRAFTFDVPEATRVFIAEVALIPSNDIAIGTRVRAYEEDKRTAFTFGDRTVPVTMYLEGKRVSPSANDLGFEYQYFAADGSTVCGGFVQGSVLRAASTLSVETGQGSPFSDHHKMLVTGRGRATATVAPVDLVTPQWSYDAGGTLSAPAALTTNFTAPDTFTPPARFGQDRLRLVLTATATNPPGLVIEANVPVNLTAPRQLEVRNDRDCGNDMVKEARTGLLDTSVGTDDRPKLFGLFDWCIAYNILDQTRASIKNSAYAGRRPQARENIGRVLTSDVDEVRRWIRRELEHSPNWTDQSDGILRDVIRALRLPKALIVTNGLFEPNLRAEGGVVMHVRPPDTHIWELSVSGTDADGQAVGIAAVDATMNRFTSTVVRVMGQGRGQQIDIRSRYTVVFP